MSEVVVVGSFTAREGKEAEALEAFEALVEPTHGEDGCILYALHRGNDDPRRLAFVERWESKDAARRPSGERPRQGRSRQGGRPVRDRRHRRVRRDARR